MRISGGEARGVTLVVPSGDAVRPATDGLRQAVFSSLAMRTPGARVVDLFAGSGAYGLEALSRGASQAVFVERHAKTSTCIQRNLEAVAKSLGRNPRELGKVVVSDALTWSPAPMDPPPDLVFIDPPYDQIETLAPALFAQVAVWVTGAQDPLLLFETPGELALQAPGWTTVKRLGGKAPRQPGVTVFRRQPPPSDPARA
ncbi:MAG: RsmD family RNA methyltransferase [Opitutaceae bacterium]|nr:RsmD family RNA methyltransferase [Opitutaceae bacterium]